MLLRVMVLLGCSFAMVGCHTIDAVRRIARPSPVTAVSVEPAEGRVRWLAEYRESSGGSDPILHEIFVRGVTKRSYLEVDPESACVARLIGDGTAALPLRTRQPLLDSDPHAAVEDAPTAQTLDICESRLGLRLAAATRYPEARAITVWDQSAELAIEVPFPVERPTLDPRRWGWLVVAPVLDAATIALSVPIAGAAVVFELLIAAMGPLQIQDIGLPVLVLTTTAKNGTTKGRVLGRAEVDGRTYVAANHWPRAWYYRALENPKVQVTLNGERTNYLAVPVAGEELDRVMTEYEMPTAIRFLTGFPPRSFLRLDPR